MNDQDKATIEAFIANKAETIKDIDMANIGIVSGVAQAMKQLKEALNDIDTCLDQRDFDKASQIGYEQVAYEFVFLQRCLAGLQDTVAQKEKFIQDICIELSKTIDNLSYEDVAPYVENKLETLKPNKKPETIEIQVGENTLEKLNAIKTLRETPIEHIAENILALAMKNDEQHWRNHEKSKPEIANIRHEEKDSYSSDEVSKHLKALSAQHKERAENLY